MTFATAVRESIRGNKRDDKWWRFLTEKTPRFNISARDDEKDGDTPSLDQ